MQRFLLLGICIWGLGCGSSHPIMEAEPQDLSVATAPAPEIFIPQELADSLGWGQLSDPTMDKVNEEFRLVLKSGSFPYHLFRITNQKKPEGEVILFWPKTQKSLNSVAPQENMKDYLQGTCTEILETAGYQYCHPDLSGTINWAVAYNSLVSNNIWILSDQSTMNTGDISSSNPWEILIETRYENYYRQYSHQNPDQYGGGPEALSILAVAAQLRQIAGNFSPAQNFNVYLGISSGVRGSDFLLCDGGEVWRFNGDLSELLATGGYLSSFEEQDSLLFFMNVQGTVRDEWYSQRENSGYSKVITPTEINNMRLVSSKKCPAN